MKKPFTIWKNEKALAAVEFALILPILIAVMVCTIDYVRYALISKKASEVAFSMADFVTQGTTVSESDLDTFMQAVPHIMYPFSFDGTVIYSSVDATPPSSIVICGTTKPCVTWQESRSLGTPPVGISSQLGAAGTKAKALSGGYLVQDGNVIIVEVYTTFTPLFAPLTNFITGVSGSTKTLYYVAVYRARYGPLDKMS